MSAVSLYYYLQVLKQIYVAKAPEGEAGLGLQQQPKPPVFGQVVVALLAAGVLVAGCVPQPIIGKLLAAIHLGGE
jgi:NADH-quinone oxidoreductase subunit N